MRPITLEELDRHDLPLVQALLTACNEAPIRSYGPREGAVASDLRVLGVCQSQTRELLGVLAIILGCPDPETVSVSRFVMAPCHAGEGIRAAACRALESWARDRGLRAVRVAVHATSLSLLSFWQRAGFVPEGSPVREGGRLFVFFQKCLRVPRDERPAAAASPCLR